MVEASEEKDHKFAVIPNSCDMAPDSDESSCKGETALNVLTPCSSAIRLESKWERLYTIQ